MITKASTAGNKVTVRDQNGATQLIATGGREIISLLATAGGASCAIRVYDTNDVTKLDESKSILIAANAGESTSFAPTQPANFATGIVVVFEQGAGNNAELFMLVN